MEVAVSNAGIRKAISGLGWAYTWAIARESLGHDPSVEEVAGWWHQSLRTTYRNQSAFRQAFPMLDSPAKIYEAPELQDHLLKAADLGDRMDKRRTDKSAIPDLEIVRIGMLTAQI